MASIGHTQTQTLHLATRPTQAERPYDFIYDPVHTLSSEVDHTRASYKAQADPTRIQRVPIYKTMFSCLTHKPKQTLRLNQVDPIPPFIARGWRGQKDLAREQLAYVTKTNYMPDVQVPEKTHPVAQVEGLDRYKFFRRPIIPFLQKLPPYVVLAPVSRPEAGMAAAAPAVMEGPPVTKTLGTQTDFRENETQTDPWSPEYVTMPGAQPELLSIANLCWNKGLPGSLAEVEMVERARAKRAWEKTLPSLSDVTHLPQRLKMMQEQEAKEWAWREGEIKKTQKERLQVLKRMLQQRESDLTAINDKRLEHLWNKKQAEKDRQVKQLRTKHVKALRKLNEKRKNVEGKLKRRDVINEYYDHGSQAYAPQTRVGQFIDIRSEQFKVRSKHLSTYSGLNDLEATLPRGVLQLRTRAPDKEAVPFGSKANREERRAMILDSVHHEIQREKELRLNPEPPKPLGLLEKVEKPVPRPPTPTIDAPAEGEEDEELSIVLLQQLLRGRAVQLKMREGKRRRRELIRELRGSHALQEAEQKLKADEKKQIELLQKTEESTKRKESLLQAGLETHTMDELGAQLDFLSKELVRLQEERRIQAFVMLAERERRMREAEESGRRQTEERRRRTEDEMIKQIMKVHQNTVDGYLQDVLMHSVQETADEKARERIQHMSMQVNQAATEFEQDRTALDGAELVADLMHSFLLPEVEKFTARERVRLSQRKHLVAAHRVIYGETQPIMDGAIEGVGDEYLATRDESQKD